MPTRRLICLIVLAGLLPCLHPSAARAGDSPIFVVHDWGIGEIDGRLMLYAGPNNAVLTWLPAPPHGPRWDIAYHAFPFALAVAVCFCLGLRTLAPRRS